MPFLIGYYFQERYPDYSAIVEYSLNETLLSISLYVRIYLIVRVTLTFTSFMQPRQQRLCTMNGVEADFIYAVKGVMKDMPYSFLGSALIISVLIPGYTLRIFERPLIPYSE